MDNNNSRARRNPVDKSRTTAPPADIRPGSGNAPPAISGSTPPANAAGAASDRTELAASTAAIERMNAAQGLQDTFVDERNDVLSVINELEDQLDRHQEIRETFERELNTCSEKLQGANQRIQELEWQVVTAHTRIESLEQLRQEVTALEEELSDANARAHQANEQFAGAEKERVRLKTDLKAANKQLDELWVVRKERDGLRADCKSLTSKIEELQRSFGEISEARATLQSEMQELQIAADEARTDRNQLQTALRTSEDRLREFAQVQETLADQVESLRAEKKNLQAQLAHLERENSRQAEQRQFFESEVTALRNQNRSAEAALASVKRAFTEVRMALSETKTRARRRAIDIYPRVTTAARNSIQPDGIGEVPTDIADTLADALGTIDRTPETISGAHLPTSSDIETANSQ